MAESERGGEDALGRAGGPTSDSNLRVGDVLLVLVVRDAILAALAALRAVLQMVVVVVVVVLVVVSSRP